MGKFRGAAEALESSPQPDVESLVEEIYFEAGQPLIDPAPGTTDAVVPRVMFDLPAKIKSVTEVLGLELAQYATAADSTDDLLFWSERASLPPEPIARRACMVATVSRELGKIWPNEMIRSWFAGTNAAIGGESPAELVREKTFAEAAGKIATAAMAEFEK